VEFVVAVATLASSVYANIGLYEVTIRLIGAFLPAFSASLVVDHPFPASAATAAPVNPIAARAANAFTDLASRPIVEEATAALDKSKAAMKAGNKTSA
jgi:hypothetical protein